MLEEVVVVGAMTLTSTRNKIITITDNKVMMFGEILAPNNSNNNKIIVDEEIGEPQEIILVEEAEIGEPQEIMLVEEAEIGELLREILLVESGDLLIMMMMLIKILAKLLLEAIVGEILTSNRDLLGEMMIIQIIILIIINRVVVEQEDGELPLPMINNQLEDGVLPLLLIIITSNPLIMDGVLVLLNKKIPIVVDGEVNPNQETSSSRMIQGIVDRRNSLGIALETGCVLRANVIVGISLGIVISVSFVRPLSPRFPFFKDMMTGILSLEKALWTGTVLIAISGISTGLNNVSPVKIPNPLSN